MRRQIPLLTDKGILFYETQMRMRNSTLGSTHCTFPSYRQPHAHVTFFAQVAKERKEITLYIFPLQFHKIHLNFVIALSQDQKFENNFNLRKIDVKTYYMSPSRGTCFRILFQFVLPSDHYDDAYPKYKICINIIILNLLRIFWHFNYHKWQSPLIIYMH